MVFIPEILVTCRNIHVLGVSCHVQAVASSDLIIITRWPTAKVIWRSNLRHHHSKQPPGLGQNSLAVLNVHSCGAAADCVADHINYILQSLDDPIPLNPNEAAPARLVISTLHQDERKNTGGLTTANTLDREAS